MKILKDHEGWRATLKESPFSQAHLLDTPEYNCLGGRHSVYVYLHWNQFQSPSRFVSLYKSEHPCICITSRSRVVSRSFFSLRNTISTTLYRRSRYVTAGVSMHLHCSQTGKSTQVGMYTYKLARNIEQDIGRYRFLGAIGTAYSRQLDSSASELLDTYIYRLNYIPAFTQYIYTGT